MEKKIFDTDKRIKLGIWGLGRGRNFVKACSALNIDVVAGCDFNDHIREGFAEVCPDAKLTANEDEFLAMDLDAVLVATFFGAHSEHAIKALDAGKHVMCEVTSFMTPAQGVRLVEAVEKSGKIYHLLENYPFMKPNMMARKLWQEGFFGEFSYGEYDYNHDCRSLSYLYIDGTHVQPGWTLHNWRSWLNSQFYCTHSLGPVMQITGLRPTRITAFPASVPHPGFVQNPGGKVGCSPSLIQMSNGGIFRNFMGGQSGDTHSRRIWGTRAAYDFTDPEACLIRTGGSGHGMPLHVKPEWPELGEYAENVGHGGGDFWELYYFAREILFGEKGPWTIFPACDVTLAGIMAVRSEKANGAPQEIPDFRDPVVRERYRDDDWIPEHFDTNTVLFPAGHDAKLTGRFTTVMGILYPWSSQLGGLPLYQSVLDGMKLYSMLANDEDRMLVIKHARRLYNELPRIVDAYREALAIGGAYPDSAADRTVKAMLSKEESAKLLDCDGLKETLQKWLLQEEC